MLLWVVIGIAVLAVGAWAFWPRQRGVVDGDVRRQMTKAQSDGAAKAGHYPGEGPIFPGGGF